MQWVSFFGRFHYKLELAEKKLALDRHDVMIIGQMSAGPFPVRYFTELDQSGEGLRVRDGAQCSTAHQRSETELNLNSDSEGDRGRQWEQLSLRSVGKVPGPTIHNPHSKSFDFEMTDQRPERHSRAETTADRKLAADQQQTAHVITV